MKNNRENKQRMLMEMLGAKPIAFNPQLARLCGSVKSGLFLSQLLYWTNRSTNDGWVYKTITEFEEETALTREEQDGAIKRLKTLGFLEVEVRGVPAKRHFKVDCVKIANKFVENLQTSLRKTHKLIQENTTDILSYREDDDVKNDISSPPLKKEKTKKCKNPNGHESCVANMEDLEKNFGKKFTNWSIQLRYMEQIYAAGFTDKDIETACNKLDKDPYWKTEGWDLITVAKKLSKGGEYAHSKAV